MPARRPSVASWRFFSQVVMVVTFTRRIAATCTRGEAEVSPPLQEVLAPRTGAPSAVWTRAELSSK
jgi:hypothetical protein